MKLSHPMLILAAFQLSCSPEVSVPKATLPAPSNRIALGNPKQITLGAQHSCVLFDSGQVMCWGSSTEYQLGEVDGKKIRAKKPTLLPRIVDAQKIDSFGNQTCLLRKTNEVVCFGGQGSKKRIHTIQGLGKVDNISVGQQSACAWNSENTWCWGSSKEGRIPGSFEQRLDKATPLNRKYTTIVGSKSSFFGKNKNQWEGWGKNEANIFQTENHQVNSFTNVYSGKAFENIVTREGVLCGWNANEIQCWSNQGKAQPPQKPEGILGKTSKVVMGNEFACALADKNVFCWGGNSKGTLGDGTQRSRPNAVSVEGLGEVIDIDAGAAHVCAITSKHAYCWGDSNSLQTGDDKRQVKTSPSRLIFEGMEGRKY